MRTSISTTRRTSASSSGAVSASTTTPRSTKHGHPSNKQYHSKLSTMGRLSSSSQHNASASKLKPKWCNLRTFLIIFTCCWLVGMLITGVIVLYRRSQSPNYGSISVSGDTSNLAFKKSSQRSGPLAGVSIGGNYPPLKGKIDIIDKSKLPDWRSAIQPDEILPRPPKGPAPDLDCTFDGPHNGFLPGCAGDNCASVNGFQMAKDKCLKDELCTGVLKTNANRELYQLRSGGGVSESPSGEVSWFKKCVIKKGPKAQKGNHKLNVDPSLLAGIQEKQDMKIVAQEKMASVRSEQQHAQEQRKDESDIPDREKELRSQLLDASLCFLDGPHSGFLGNCAEDGCTDFDDFDKAKQACLHSVKCLGIVHSGTAYQLRADPTLRESPRGETSFIKLCGDEAYNRIRALARATPSPQCVFSGPTQGFIANCAGTDCTRFYYFHEASEKCLEMGDACAGITRLPTLRNGFELRANGPVRASESGEYSYLKVCGDASATEKPDPFTDSVIKYEKVGSKINDLPTIFVGVASYRDSMCHNSVYTAFAHAKHPERVFVGVVQQNAEMDPDCVVPSQPCEDNPEQIFCKYKDHIRIEEIHARDAAGPTFGRHHADLLYEGEYFAVQVDAHMSFIRDWDEVAIEEWSALDNEYAILTTYPSEVKNNMDEYGRTNRETAPLICDTRILHNNMFKHQAAGEIRFPDTHKHTPMISPFLGAGVVFSRGHRIVRVPYDCCLPMVFDGEEFTMGARAWTNGYDLYAPYKSFAFHPYNREQRPPLFWEQPDKGRSQKSHRRIMAILGMPQLTTDDYDKTDIVRYGLGNVRPFQQYLKVFGINLETKETTNHCNEAFAGRLHDRLHSFIRKDGRGIDYNRVYVSKHDSERFGIRAANQN